MKQFIRRKPTSGRAGVIVRLGVIVLLAGCAWFVWVKDPLNPDRRRAAQFCQSVVPDMSAVAVMQAATARGATGFATPEPGVLSVSFGKSVCSVAIGAAPARPLQVSKRF